MKTPLELPQAQHPIDRADVLASGIIVSFKNGEQRAYPADALFEMEGSLTIQDTDYSDDENDGT